MVKKNEEISLKNTKQEILDALNDALEREKKKEVERFEPEVEAKKKMDEKAVVETRKNVEDNIFSEELNNKFKSLEIAIKVEEDKLKELFDIEKELNHLVVASNAGHELLEKLRIEKEEEENSWKEKIELLEKEYNEKKKNLEEEYKNQTLELEKNRKREVEEYTYQTKRERELDHDKWEEEKKKREVDLANKENEVSVLLKDAKEKEKYLQELEKKVDDIPSLLEKEYKRGCDEVSKTLERENKYQKDLMEKDYSNTIDRQKDKIESLEKEIDALNNQNNKLQDKLDKAYSEIKDMATKTVQATGGLKILNSHSKEEEVK